MTYIEGNTLADVYSQVIDKVLNHYDYQSAPRGLKIRECMNAMIKLNDPTSNLFRCNDKSVTMPTAYTKKEAMLYLSGTNSAELFSKAAPFWNGIKNNDETINSAYGNLIFNPTLKDGRSQFDWAFDSLKTDKDSRQAIMRYNNTCHQLSNVRDFPCTFIQCFHIRDNKLHSTVEMRSNDIVKGFVHDVPGFTLFQHLMLLKLREEAYPDLELGIYTHIANSLHVYENDFEMCQKRLDAGLIQNSYALPKDWRVIKSNDISKMIDLKIVKGVKGIENLNDIDMRQNLDFYTWLMS